MQTPSDGPSKSCRRPGAEGADTEADRAVCRSVLYAALASALRPPTAENLERLRGTDGSPVLVSAAARLDDLASPSSNLASIVDEAVVSASRADLQELALSYQRLFGHTARGKVPPYDTEYGRGGGPFGQTRELVDINGFYRAFGLAVDERKGERSDHVSVECEFLSFLTCKESILDSDDDGATLVEVRKAERLFLQEHLGRFGRAFARSLRAEADHPFYASIGELGFAFWTAECEYLGVPLGREVIQLRPEQEVAVPMACEPSCPLAQESPSPER